MAICHSRATTDREASNVQCAEQKGVPPLPNNKRPRSKQHPVRRAKRRSATADQQKTAKQTTSNAQTKMAFCHYRPTTDREANNLQCANQNGVPPHPNNKRFTPLQTARHGSQTSTRYRTEHRYCGQKHDTTRGYFHYFHRIPSTRHEQHALNQRTDL